MTSRNPVAAAQRRYRKTLKLGADACCIGCGLRNPTQLTTAPTSMLDAHHPFGFQHAPDVTVVVCRNCHALYSAGQLDDGVPLQSQSTVPELVHAILVALASFLRVTVEFLFALAERIPAFVEALDTQYPEWRGAPWAR